LEELRLPACYCVAWFESL